MKYLITLAILIIFSAGLRAQEMSGYNDDENNGAITVVEKVTASGAGLNTTYYMKHKGDFKISDLVLKSERTSSKLINCSDDDVCGENPGSCHSNAFIWGALSIVAGLLAFTGIKR